MSRGALLDRVEQDDVAQLDDRRLAGRLLEVEDVDVVVVVGAELDVVGVDVAEHVVVA